MILSAIGAALMESQRFVSWDSAMDTLRRNT